MNRLTLVSRYDYIAYLNFLNIQYGNDISCNFNTRVDETVMYTCLKTQVLAMVLQNRLSGHVVYMIYPDEYGIAADRQLVNERTDTNPLPPDYSQTKFQCHWTYPDNSLCQGLATGCGDHKHYCDIHKEEYKRQYEEMYKQS